MKKVYFLLIALCLCMTSVSASKVIIKDAVGGVFFGNISDNGRWVVGTFGGAGAIWDMKADTSKVFIDDVQGASANDVTNDGVIVGSYNNRPAICKNGVWSYLKTNNDEYATGSAASVTPDGSVIVGYCFDEGFNCLPYKWVNGEIATISLLENDQMGMPVKAGFALSGISADGTKFIGRLIDDNYNWIGMLWNPEPIMFGKDMIMTDGTFNDNIYETGAISTNGKYITGLYSYYTPEDFFNPVKVPYCYNTETNIFDTFDSAVNCEGTSVTDDGIVFGYYNEENSPIGRKVYVFENGEGKLLEDYILEKYKINIMDYLSETGTLMACTGDGKTLIGVDLVNQTNYYIQLGDLDGIENTTAGTLSAYISETTLHLHGNIDYLKISNLSGQEVYQAANPANEINLSNLEKGIYLVSLSGSNNTKTQKIILK